MDDTLHQTADRKSFGRHWQNGFVAGALLVVLLIIVGVAMGALSIG